MSKEILVDTSFFEKITCHGKHLDFYDKIVINAGYIPVVHPYLAENELDVHPYFKTLCDNGKVRIASYDEFIEDDFDRKIYSDTFLRIHNDLCDTVNANNNRKHLDKLKLPAGQTVFTYRKAKMSLGDVHMILMAFYTAMPIILTEDSDIDILRSIASRYIDRTDYTLDIMSSVDLIRTDVSNHDFVIEKKELENIVKAIGERDLLSEIKAIWKQSHNIE